MSLFNAYLTRDRAFVASDTLAMLGETAQVAGRFMGGPTRRQKVLPLPGARVLLGFRSNDVALTDAVARAAMDDLEDADTGLRAVPELLHSAVLDAIQSAGYASPDDVPESSPIWSAQVFMIGWSESAQGMVLLMARYAGRQQRVTRVFGEEGQLVHCLSCSAPDYRPTMPTSIQQLAAETQALVHLAREAGEPGAKGVGGALIACEITRDTLTMTRAGELGLPPGATVAHQYAVAVAAQNATVPQVGTDGIAPDSVAPIATATAGGSTVYLIETTIVSASIDSKGSPIYVSLSVDANGSYSGDKATFKVKIGGTTYYTKDITSTRDGSQVGNPWFVKGALVQTVIASPGTGTKTIDITAIGTHATYGVTVENANLYCEGKLR